MQRFVEHESCVGERPTEAPLTLTDCLRRFSRTEQLGENDMWYCGTCKAHVQAFKKMDLWNAPEVLVVQLKRFQYVNGAYFVHGRKLDNFVEFPVEGLDLSPHVIGPRDQSLVYDLYAVSVRMCCLLGCRVLYCTVLYCTVLYCTVLYCTVLYCTVLSCRVVSCCWSACCHSCHGAHMRGWRV